MQSPIRSLPARRSDEAFGGANGPQHEQDIGAERLAEDARELGDSSRGLTVALRPRPRTPDASQAARPTKRRLAPEDGAPKPRAAQLESEGPTWGMPCWLKRSATATAKVMVLHTQAGVWLAENQLAPEGLG